MRSFFWTISARHGKERSANLKFKWRRKTYTQMNAAVRFVVIPGAYTEKMCANMCSHSALLYRLRPPTRGFCLDCKTPGSKSTGMPQIYTCGIYTGYKPVLEIWRPSLTPMVIEKNSRKHIRSRSRFRIENRKNEIGSRSPGDRETRYAESATRSRSPTPIKYSTNRREQVG